MLAGVPPTFRGSSAFGTLTWKVPGAQCVGGSRRKCGLNVDRGPHGHCRPRKPSYLSRFCEDEPPGQDGERPGRQRNRLSGVSGMGRPVLSGRPEVP